MKFSVAAVAAAFATLASAQDCPEAARFGGLSVTPDTMIPGQTFTLTNNLTCAPVKGIHPRFIDYFLQVPPEENNGFQPIIYLGRSTFDVSNPPKTDVLVGKIPLSPNVTGYGFASTVIYPIDFTDANAALIEGGTEL